METFVVELTHKNALPLLRELEALDIIKLHGHPSGDKKLSSKYRGALSQTEGKDLEKHISEMRREWNSI
jgi:hypothetical protein